MSLGFIAMKKHHDHGNSYKGKHLFGGWFAVQSFSLLSSWWEASWHAGLLGAGERNMSSSSSQQAAGRELSH